MGKIYKIIFIFLLFGIFTGSTFAKDIYVNEKVTSSGDCLTEGTACKSFSEAMNLAEKGDVIILKSNITEGETRSNDTISLKGVTIEGNSYNFTIRGAHLSLTDDVILKNLTLSFLQDGSRVQKIYMNGHNLTLNSVITGKPDNHYIGFTVVAGSKTATRTDLEDFVLNIENSPNAKFKQILTSGEDGGAVPVTVKIPSNVSVLEVKGENVKSGTVISENIANLNFSNLNILELKAIKGVNPFNINNVGILKLSSGSDIPVSLMNSIDEIIMQKGTILSLQEKVNPLKLKSLQSLDSQNSQEKPKIKLTNNNSITTDRIADTEFFFEIDTAGHHTDAEGVFITVPENSKDLVKGELILRKVGDNRKFSELGTENGKTKFGLPSKNIDKTELKKLLEEYDSLEDDEKDRLDKKFPEVYNNAFYENQNVKSTVESVKEDVDALREALNFIKNPLYNSELEKAKQKAKEEIEKLEHLTQQGREAFNTEIDLSNSINKINAELEKAKKDNELLGSLKELEKLLSKANDPKTLEGKTEDSKNVLNEKKNEAQNIYDNKQSTLEQIKEAIKSLSTAINKANLDQKLAEYEALPKNIKDNKDLMDKIAKVLELSREDNPATIEVQEAIKAYEDTLLPANKAELKKLLDKASDSKTTEGKTDETVKNLKTKKEEAQKIYDNNDSTLEQIKAEITKLDEVIKGLKDKTKAPSTGSSSGGSSSSSSSSGGKGSSSSGGSYSSGGGRASYISSNSKKEDKKDETKKVDSKEKNLEKTEIKTEIDKYEKVRKYFKERNREFKIKNISGKDKLYTVSNDFSSCPMISNIVGEYNKDYKINFSDLKSISNLDEIQRLTKVGILNEKGVNNSGYFESSRGITRAEFLAIVLQVHCYDISKKPENLPFYDVDLNSWQAKVVKVANEIGLIKGYEADSKGTPFKPNQIISKIEAFSIMMKMKDITILEKYEDKYKDKKASWQSKILAIGEYLGILNPEKTNFNFYPNGKLNREDMAKTIVDIIKLY